MGSYSDFYHTCIILQQFLLFFLISLSNNFLRSFLSIYTSDINIFRLILNKKQWLIKRSIQYMSVFARDLGIDLSFLSHQGVYVSSSRFSCIEQYFEPIEFPPHSAYHIISMHNPQLMAKCMVEPIITTFINASQKCKQNKRNMIFDLSLPYHDQYRSNRTFQGRYIIFNGALLGVKLNTAMEKIGSAYSFWPKHTAKHADLKMMGKEYSFLIGDISLLFLNVRIGLLFQSQLHISAQEYLNEGYDILVLTYESMIIQDSTLQKKNDLSRQIILIEGAIDSFSRPLSKQAMDLMLSDVQTPLRRQKSIIYLQYYDLNKTLRSKNRQYFSQNQNTFITPIQINLAFTQVKIKNQYSQSQTTYELIQQAFSLQKSHKYDINDFLSIFYRRLFLFFIRSSSKKLVIILEDSPYILCFLYLIECIFQQNSCINTQTLIRKLTFINLPKSNHKIFSKFKFLNLQKTQESICDNESNTGNFVKTLDHISAHQIKQSYFILITTDQQVKLAVEMLNKREIVKLEKQREEEESEGDDPSLQCLSRNDNTLKTWITTNFFSSKELKQIYFSQQFITFFADQQQRTKIWNKFAKQQQFHSISDILVNKMEISLIQQQSIKIQELLLKNHHLQLQFQSHYSKVMKYNIELSKTQLFSHFLFRKIVSIDFYSDEENQANMFIQLLMTDEHNIIRSFNFLTRHALSTFEELSKQLKLNLIASENSSSKKLKCHSCEGQFSYEVMYLCQFEECKQTFCFMCLLNFKCYQEKALLKQAKINPMSSRLCPICRGLCKNCDKCESKRISLSKQFKRCVNSNFQQCHYCNQSNNLYSYQCSITNCQKYFCLKCIDQLYRVRTKQYEKTGWKCFVCQHRCFCNNCQLQKAMILGLRCLSPQAAKREKKQVSKRSCLKKPIQMKDLGCQIVQIDEHNAVSIDGSTSIIYNEETQYKSPKRPVRAASDKLRALASPQISRVQTSNLKRRHSPNNKMQTSSSSEPKSPHPSKKLKRSSKKSYKNSQ